MRWAFLLGFSAGRCVRGQLPCLRDRNRRRRDSRVTVSRTATASAMSPATWPVSPGWTNAMAEEPGTGAAFRRSVPLPGDGLGVAPGLIAGNNSEALPAPMSELEMLLRFGTGPSGSVVPGAAGGALDVGEPPAEAAAVTATVSAAAGGVHLAEVVTLAVAVSFTEVTEVASDATGICACRVTGCLSDTALTGHLADPLLSPQPPVNKGFWLDGWEVRATVTPDADPPSLAETCTM